ncbi:MAG: hypothetical protein EZS28_025327 [Streblomastix strix]|uniref:Uncharacterized protein n=1 Tax=Streblomastix strix TaxID=222440 RepID=A0A5J4V9H3_9EUKA|nr:MAG: hypothetical protein EZS28_025327 [Streblomastix strix]
MGQCCGKDTLRTSSPQVQQAEGANTNSQSRQGGLDFNPLPFQQEQVINVNANDQYAPTIRGEHLKQVQQPQIAQTVISAIAEYEPADTKK